MTKLIDIGLNLAHDSFDPDRDATLQRARAVDVEYMIVTGSSLKSTEAAIDLVSRYPSRLRATAGIHPHHAGEFPSTARLRLQELASRSEVVATGECGLDFFRNFSTPAEQERVFRLQLELACELKKPLFLHQREAHDPFVAILKEYMPRIVGGVAHCFTEDFAKARTYLDMGLYIGVTGWLCDERRGQALREAAPQLPLDRILIETDAPYLLPRNLVPKPASRRNEPAYLPHVLHTLAELRAESVAVVGEATSQNAIRLFGWPAL